MNTNPLVPFDSDFLNEAYFTLCRLSDELGTSFPIPPKTANVVKEMRRSMKKMQRLIDDSRQQHLGWMDLVRSGMSHPSTEPLILFMLWQELSETHDLPIGFFSCLGLIMRSDPGIMKVYNRGVVPFFLDKNNNPTANTKMAVRCTPHFHRAAWDGGFAGYWDVEDVMMLPSSAHPSMSVEIEDYESIIGTDVLGAEVYFA